MKKILILLNTKEDNIKIENAIRSYFKNNTEEHLIKKLEVKDEI